MPKKSVKNTSSKSKKTKRSSSKNEKTSDKNQKSPIEDKLIENLVALQKVNTNMAEKFDKLSKQISHLLLLFETTAKSFAEQPGMEKDQELIKKIDTLIDQNKIIARGMTLLGDNLKGPQQVAHSPQTMPRPQTPVAKPVPPPQTKPPSPQQNQPAPKAQPVQNTQIAQPIQQPQNNQTGSQVKEIEGNPPEKEEKQFKPKSGGKALPKF